MKVWLLLFVCLWPLASAADEWLYFAEANRLHRIALDSLDAGERRREVFIPSSADVPGRGRDINGMVCPVPGSPGWIVTGEDTGQPGRRAGWGVHDAHGRQIGKLVAQSEASVPDPFGCAFDSEGRLFTSDIGDPGFGAGNGMLLMWFPPYDRAEPAADESGPVCVLASDIGTAGALAFDVEGRLYVASSSGFAVHRFSPPFPASLQDCGRVVPPRDVFRRGLATYSGLARAPNGNLYVASVATGRIDEIDLGGRVVRAVLEPPEWLPPFSTGFPQGLAVDGGGTLYYADLDLTWRGWMPGPGRDGKIWRIRFGADGAPREPEMLVNGLLFPDAVSVLSTASGGEP